MAFYRYGFHADYACTVGRSCMQYCQQRSSGQCCVPSLKQQQQSCSEAWFKLTQSLPDHLHRNMQAPRFACTCSLVSPAAAQPRIRHVICCRWQMGCTFCTARPTRYTGASALRPYASLLVVRGSSQALALLCWLSLATAILLKLPLTTLIVAIVLHRLSG